MTTIFSIITRVALISKETFAEAIIDADVMADAAIMGIMATNKTEIDFWTRLYKIMYRTMAIVNMVLFGIMVLKAIFGINLAFWVQWSVETLLKRICDHLQVQGVRMILRSKKLAKEDLTYNEFVDIENEDFELVKARVNMVNNEAEYMMQEINFGSLRHEFISSGMKEKHVFLKNDIEVIMTLNDSDEVDFKVNFSDETWNIAARRVARAISINR